MTSSAYIYLIGCSTRNLARDEYRSTAPFTMPDPTQLKWKKDSSCIVDTTDICVTLLNTPLNNRRLVDNLSGNTGENWGRQNGPWIWLTHVYTIIVIPSNIDYYFVKWYQAFVGWAWRERGLAWGGPDVRGAWLLCTLFTSSNNYLFLSFSIVKAGKSSPPTQGNPACSSRIIVDVSIQPHDVWLAKIWPLSKGLVWLETSIHFDETLLHLSRMQDMYSRVTREWPESFLEVAHATTELLVSDILHFRMQPSFPNSSPAKVSLSVLRVWRTVYSSTTYYSLHVIEVYIILRPPYKVYGYLAFANNIQSTTTITVQ